MKGAQILESGKRKIKLLRTIRKKFEE